MYEDLCRWKYVQLPKLLRLSNLNDQKLRSEADFSCYDSICSQKSLLQSVAEDISVTYTYVVPTTVIRTIQFKNRFQCW